MLRTQLETMRIMVVDDDVDFRLLLQVQLDLAPGLEVVCTAGDGAEALECVAAHDVDAVAMDLLMPRMNGFEAIQHLRTDRPDVGIVAYTAVDGDHIRAQMERFGVELVVKSGDASELAAALRRSVAG